jgi:hypothetical protein
MRTMLDEVINWNRRKAKVAKDPKDRTRYEQNIRDLEAYKETDNGRS